MNTHVLSRLPKLEAETEKQPVAGAIHAMPITYDIATDYLYNKGIEKGIEEGIKLTIREMASDPTMTLEQIARFTRTSVEYVKRVIRESK